MSDLLDEAKRELKTANSVTSGIFIGVFARVAIVIAESFVRIASALEFIARRYNVK
jgi:hypothetical protein